MKRYLLAAVASVMFVGFVAAEEFWMDITSINADGSVTGKKEVKGEKSGFGKFKVKSEEVTVKLARDVRVHKGKIEKIRYTADGDDLKLVGLKAAVLQAQNGSVLVDGKAIGENDHLELSMHDDKPAAKLNGKDVPFATVQFLRKGPLRARVTTSDDGVATTILIIPPVTGAVSFFELWEKKAEK